MSICVSSYAIAETRTAIHGPHKLIVRARSNVTSTEHDPPRFPASISP